MGPLRDPVDPGMGLIAGSALLVDCVLTIAVSLASGTDGLFQAAILLVTEHRDPAIPFYLGAGIAD